MGNDLPLVAQSPTPLVTSFNDLAVPAPARFIALVRDSADRFRIINALRGRASVELVDTVAALEARLAEGAIGLLGVLLEPHDIQGTPTASAVMRLRPMLGGVPVIGYCAAGHSHSKEILALARAGVDELLFRSEMDTRTALLAAVASATQASAAQEVLGAVTPHVRPSAVPLVSHCVHHAREALDTDALASAFGISRATLIRRCQEYGLPHPWALIGWCRLLVVGYLLQFTGRTVEDLALALEFPSPSAFRNFVKRYTGLRALDLRAAGGMQTVLTLFLAPSALGRRKGRRAGGTDDGGGDDNGSSGGEVAGNDVENGNLRGLGEDTEKRDDDPAKDVPPSRRHAAGER